MICALIPGLGRSPPWSRELQPTPVFLPGESHEPLEKPTIHSVSKSRT